LFGLTALGPFGALRIADGSRGGRKARIKAERKAHGGRQKVCRDDII
jgi:hypothetical protein